MNAIKTYFIMGVANKKSVAYSVAKILESQGHQLIISVQNADILDKVSQLLPLAKIIICDVSKQSDIDQLSYQMEKLGITKVDGFLHSLAFAHFDDSTRIFHKVSLEKFQQAMQISCYSLVQVSNAIESILDQNASVVTVGISDIKATVYGFLGPIKATLESMIPYLAKSFSAFSKIRFNIVCAGPLKTSASAGIPGYVENYLFSEKLTLRKQALKTQEVANTIVFLLSNLSSGINGEKIVIDAGMGANGFDEEIVNSSSIR